MMKRHCLLMLLCFGVLMVKSQEKFQLATPLVSYTSLIFQKQATVQLQFALPGAKIHYSTNGNEPTEKDKLYRQPIIITGKHTHLKARVFSNGFAPSATVALEFIRQGLALSTISGTNPDKKYEAKGLASLHDGQGGQADIGNGQWLGYNGDTATWMVALAQDAKPRQVLLHCLQQPGSWIFLPRQIKVYAANSQTGKYMLVGQLTTTAPKADAAAVIVPLKISLNNNPKTRQLKIVCHPLWQLPAWHPGVGQKAWVFIDEIIVY